MATYDKTKPAAGSVAANTDDELRDNFDALQDAIGRNHDFPGTYGGDAGEHTIIELQEQAASPSNEANMYKIYGKDASSITELFLQDSDGNEMQLTSGGVIQASVVETLKDITASVAELNILDGVTATYAELNTVADGSTAKNDHTHGHTTLDTTTEEKSVTLDDDEGDEVDLAESLYGFYPQIKTPNGKDAIFGMGGSYRKAISGLYYSVDTGGAYKNVVTIVNKSGSDAQTFYVKWAYLNAES